MRLHVDQKADVLYLRLDESTIVESEEISPGVVLDYNAENQVVGVEILHLSKRVPNLEPGKLSLRPRPHWLERSRVVAGPNSGEAEAVRRRAQESEKVTPRLHSEEQAMIRELDTVVLTKDLLEHGLKRGDLGTVVLIHATVGYEVEFMTLDGQTLTVVSLVPHQVRPVGRGEIAQARAVA